MCIVFIWNAVIATVIFNAIDRVLLTASRPPDPDCQIQVANPFIHFRWTQNGSYVLGQAAPPKLMGSLRQHVHATLSQSMMISMPDMEHKEDGIVPVN